MVEFQLSPFALSLSKGVARDEGMAFYAYILRCADRSYYTGHTDNLEARLAQHERGTLPCYTHDRRPVTLAWCEAFPTREEALAAERRIKGWSRAKKEALIAGDWQRISMLARNRRGPSTSSGRTGLGDRSSDTRSGG